MHDPRTQTLVRDYFADLAYAANEFYIVLSDSFSNMARSFGRLAESFEKIPKRITYKENKKVYRQHINHILKFSGNTPIAEVKKYRNISAEKRARSPPF